MGSSSGKILAAMSVLGVFALAGTLLLTGFIGVRQRISEVVIEIDYFNHWNVTVCQNDSTQSWSGFGKMERTLIGPLGDEWVISITARKTDGSSGNLSVRIKQVDGTIVKEASTSAPFGTVCISYTIR
jgi:hypothetical protein